MGKLAIIYGTGFGNTGIMAKAISEGAKESGIEVHIKNVLDAELSDVKDADAIAIGSPTYKGKAIPSVLNFVEKLSELNLENKIGAAFGSYGWSGEAAEVINKILKSYGMDVIEPNLRIKRTPEGEGIESCKELGRKLAEKIK